MSHPPGPEPRGSVLPLVLSLAWMFAVQLACVVAWDAGWLTRSGALVHWLLVGVLPPALALWTSGPAPRAGAKG
jgi:hypothetical protein